MPDGLVPLQEFLDRLTEAAHDAHKSVHAQEAIARDEAAKRIDARLEQLNELRSEVITDRGRFVNREAFDAKLEAIDARINALHDQITEWKGRGQGLSMTASLVVGAVGLVGALVALYFAFAG